MNELHEKVISICLDVIEMERHEIGLDEPFRSFSHIDSLKAMDLLTALEFNFGIKIPEREVREFESIAKVIAVAEKYVPAPANS